MTQLKVLQLSVNLKAIEKSYRDLAFRQQNEQAMIKKYVPDKKNGSSMTQKETAKYNK